MDFNLPTAYVELKKQVSDFAATLPDTTVERDADSRFDPAIWQACADFGLLKLAAPAAFGGDTDGIDIFKAVLAMEGFGYACKDNGLALALNAQMWTVQLTIAHHGTPEQQAYFLPKMVKGEWIGAHALTEAEAGSDVFSMQTTATAVEGGYLLNGSKRLITLAPIADMVLLFANAKPELGKWGVTAFLLETNNPGLQLGPNQPKMGLRTVPFGEIYLKDCFVSADRVLGSVGAGFSICNHSLEFDRCGILAGHLGAMERQLEATVAFAKERQQFGQPIAQFQSISNRVANMKLRLETARLLLYKLAWLKQNDRPAILEASMLKLFLSESFVDSSLDALRIRGGSGYLTEWEVERDLRDAVGGVLYAGTSDIQRNIIAKFSGL